MATTTYTINVNTTQAQAELSKLQNSFKGLGNTALNLKTAFAGFITASAISSLVEFSDAVTNINNKLITISKSQSDANTQFNAMVAIAMSTRTSLESVTAVYNKMMMASETLGINQKQAAEYTTTLAQALKLTGASTAEANSVMLQFSQGLSSGVFQGDELRAILEGNIVITKALAKEMGVSTTEIKKLGSEGKITADIMLRALGSSAKEIASNFARMVPTISDSLGTLRTSMMSLWQTFESTTKTGQSISKSIEYIAYSLNGMKTSLDSIIGPVMTFLSFLLKLGAAFAALAFVRVIATIFIGLAAAMAEVLGVIEGGAAATLLFGTRLAALIANVHPVIRTITLLGSVVAAVLAMFGVEISFQWIKSFGDDASETSKELAKMKEESAKTALAGLDASNKVATGKNQVTDASKKLSEQISRETAALEKQIQTYKDANITALSDIKLNTVKLNMSESDKSVLDAQIKAFDDYRQQYNQIQADINAKRATGSEADLAMIPKLIAAQNELTRAYEEQVPALNAATEAYTAAYNIKQLSLYQTSTEIANQDKLNSLYDEIAKSGLSTLEQKYYDLEVAARNSAKAAVEAEASRRNIKVADMPISEINAYYDAAFKGIDKLKKAQQEQYEVSRSFSTGWKQAFNEYVDNATNAADQAKQIFDKMTKGIEDALFSMVKSGKFAWKDLLNTMVDELLRSQIRQLVANVGTGLSSNKSGGGFFSSLLGFANGGIIPTNGPVIVGERGPELLSNAGGMSVTPNNQLGTNVTYNINAVDALSFKQMLAADPTFLYAVSLQGARTLPGRI